DPAVVIGHVRPVHRAQRDTHGRCNRRLRHPALAQQYHLDALTLHGGNFPAQRRLQLPDLGLAAFDHLFPLRIRWSERITPCSSKTIPFSRIRNQRKNPRFNQLWKRYQDSSAHGSRRSWSNGSGELMVRNHWSCVSNAPRSTEATGLAMSGLPCQSWRKFTIWRALPKRTRTTRRTP